MCLAVPALITAIDSATDLAQVYLGGVTKEVSLALMEEAQVGDYVLVHVGYALGRISPEEAERTLALIAEAGGQADSPPFPRPLPQEGGERVLPRLTDPLSPVLYHEGRGEDGT